MTPAPVWHHLRVRVEDSFRSGVWLLAVASAPLGGVAARGVSDGRFLSLLVGLLGLTLFSLVATAAADRPVRGTSRSGAGKPLPGLPLGPYQRAVVELGAWVPAWLVGVLIYPLLIRAVLLLVPRAGQLLERGVGVGDVAAGFLVAAPLLAVNNFGHRLSSLRGLVPCAAVGAPLLSLLGALSPAEPRLVAIAGLAGVGLALGVGPPLARWTWVPSVERELRRPPRGDRWRPALGADASLERDLREGIGVAVGQMLGPAGSVGLALGGGLVLLSEVSLTVAVAAGVLAGLVALGLAPALHPLGLPLTTARPGGVTALGGGVAEAVSRLPVDPRQVRWRVYRLGVRTGVGVAVASWLPLWWLGRVALGEGPHLLWSLLLLGLAGALGPALAVAWVLGEPTHRRWALGVAVVVAVTLAAALITRSVWAGLFAAAVAASGAVEVPRRMLRVRGGVARSGPAGGTPVP